MARPTTMVILAARLRGPAALVCALLVAAAAPGQGRAADVPAPAGAPGAVAPGAVLAKPVERALKNQMKLYVVEDHRLPVVTMRFTIRAGSADEPADKAGLANFTVEAMKRGTARRTQAELERAVADLGGEIQVHVGRDEMSLTGRFLSRDWRAGLDLLSDIVQNPAFRGPDVEKCRQEVLESIENARQQTSVVALDHADALVYGSHPYGRPVTGNGESVSNITREDLVRFHDSYFLPNLALLVVVGDVDANEMDGEVEAQFRTWAPASPTTRPSPELPAFDANRIRILDAPGLARAELKIGFAGVARSDADYFPLMVMNYILGGSGASSRLGRSVGALPGAGATASSAFDFGRDRGAFFLTASAADSSVRSTVRAALATLNAFATEGPSASEVEAAKQTLLGATPVALQGQETIAAQWTAVDLYGLGIDTFDRYADRVRGVTAADVKRVAHDHLRSDKLAIVCVAPADSVRHQLEAFGAPEALDYLSPTGTIPQSKPSTAIPSEAVTPEAMARARAVVERALKAHGGALKLKAVKDVSTLATDTFSTPTGPLDAEVLMSIRMPDRTRIEMNMLGQRGVQVLDGERGFATSGGAITDLTAEQAQAMRAGLKVQVLPLLSRLAKGDSPIGWFGADVVNADSVDVIWIFDPDATSKASFSRKTGLLVRLEQEEPAMFGMGKVPMSRQFSDYRPVDGFQLPFRIDRFARGERLVVDRLKSYDINHGIPDSQFQRPVR